MDDTAKTTESMPSTAQTMSNEANENVQQNETHDASDSVAKPTDSSDNLYPSFHVTYWMFYPYSQVSDEISFQILKCNWFWIKILTLLSS